MSKPDYLQILTDVTEYSYPRFKNEVCRNIDQREAIRAYFTSWADTIEKKLDHEDLDNYPHRYCEMLSAYCDARIKEEAKLKASLEKQPTRVAKLITFELTTRVIINENKDMPEVETEDAYNAAIEKFKANNDVEHWICMDNCTEIVDDTECPFGSFYDDK